MVVWSVAVPRGHFPTTQVQTTDWGPAHTKQDPLIETDALEHRKPPNFVEGPRATPPASRTAITDPSNKFTEPLRLQVADAGT